MKKVFILLIFILAVATFAACGSNAQEEESNEAVKSETTFLPETTQQPTATPQISATQGDKSHSSVREESSKAEETESPEPTAEVAPTDEDDSASSGGFDLKAALDPPAVWYTAGMYKVGTDIPAGEYYIKADEEKTAYFCLSSDSSGDSILYNGNPKNNYFLTVSDGQYLQVKRGTFTLSSEIRPLAYSGDLEEGMYRVGYDIPAGEYRAVPHSGKKVIIAFIPTPFPKEALCITTILTGQPM